MLVLPLGCVDLIDQPGMGQLDLVVVDGTITNLDELQLIRLNRSTTVSGLPGSVPITKAAVEVVVDSGQVLAATETTDGTYQFAREFRGQIGHTYQLRFTLADGTRYESTPQGMPAVPPITTLRAQFNPISLPAQTPDGQVNLSRSAHDIYLDTQDPADQRNYYSWGWTLYERQLWCRSCQLGVYSVNKVLPNTYLNSYYFVTGTEPYEDCFTPPVGQESSLAPVVPGGSWTYDYNCRTDCWEILRNVTLNLFDDVYSNGGLITGRKVAQIPFYQRAPCLVDIRQASLTREAYQYYRLFEEQSQNSGGLADAPPTAVTGNVHNVRDEREIVVGYFTASAVSVNHYWLDRKDAVGTPIGAMDPTGPHENEGEDLFYALYGRRPSPEPPPPYTFNRPEAKVRLWPNTDRPPTALCVSSTSKTPFKPEGWRD